MALHIPMRRRSVPAEFWDTLSAVVENESRRERTLFVLPAVYMLVAKNHNKVRQRDGELREFPEERKLQHALA
jgi:hypothetical protein